MCRPAALSAWIAELGRVFPHLSRPQIKSLAEYSFGLILAQRCGLSCVAMALSQWIEQSFDTVRERLRDFYCSGPDKRGRHRRSLDVQHCFAPLLRWVLRDWKGKQLPIAMDATTLGNRFVVLAISVVYRADAIPVAWVVLPATAKGQWKPHWIRLLQLFKDTVPPHLQVIVLADRGLYARWLFKQIVDLGWHPLMRINAHCGVFTPEGASEAVAMESIPLANGQIYARCGMLFRKARTRLSCTLTARHGPIYTDPWYVISDLPPEQIDIEWYALRAWIERAFKHDKSGGWNWQMTRMSDPDRASRAWLVMSVATLLVIRQGTAHEPSPPTAASHRQPAAAPNSRTPDPQSKPRKPRRILSLFRAGLMIMQAALLAGTSVPRAHFRPELWPHHDSDPKAKPQTAYRPP